jgi:predicted metal-dependent phosphoesterase TrpH
MRDGGFLIDLHNHTLVHSDDSLLRPEDLVRRAKQLGLDAVCITEHDRPWDPEELANLSKALDFPIFPGMEINTEEGHVLVFGLDRYVFGMHRLSFVRKMVEEAGGAMVLAHPYRRQLPPIDGSGTPVDYYVEKFADRPHYDFVDALEVFNGRGIPRENEFSYKMALRRRLPGAAGSDAHRIEDVATCATRFEKRITSLEELIAELRAGRYSPVILREPEKRIPFTELM